MHGSRLSIDELVAECSSPESYLQRIQAVAAEVSDSLCLLFEEMAGVHVVSH
jgi:hypothetical protein